MNSVFKRLFVFVLFFIPFCLAAEENEPAAAEEMKPEVSDTVAAAAEKPASEEKAEESKEKKRSLKHRNHVWYR